MFKAHYSKQAVYNLVFIIKQFTLFLTTDLFVSQYYVRQQEITRCGTSRFFSFVPSLLVSLNTITKISTVTILFSPTYSLIRADQTLLSHN